MTEQLETGPSQEKSAWAAYESGKFAEALAQFLDLARGGSPYYFVVAAQMFANGMGASIDKGRARDLLDQAMSLNVPEAYLQQALLANMEGDAASAFRLLLEANRRGLRAARYYLAICYLNGRGVEKNIDKGMELLRQASGEGYLGAQIMLAKRTLKSPPGLFEFIEALWLLLSASAKHLILAVKSPHDERIR